MDIKSNERLLYFLQVANSSFPTGAFNHSYGFETWIDSEQVSDAKSFECACRDWLLYGVASADGAAVAHAHRLIQKNSIDELVKLDNVTGALKLTRESREASDKMGHALLSAIQNIFEPINLKSFQNAIQTKRCSGHQSVIYGVAAGDMRLPEKETVTSFLQASFSNLASVASRIIPLGQIETQKIILEAWPLILEATEISQKTKMEEMGTSMAALDVASMKHEHLHTRLCMS